MSAKQTSSCLWLGLVLVAMLLQPSECQYYGYPYGYAGASAAAGSGYGNLYGSGMYGYPYSYGGYPYYSYPGYNPYSMFGGGGGYGQYGYPYGGYPYGGNAGNGMNVAYASSSGGFATASAGGSGYYG
ncbi:neuropeptide-like protein 31 isoform X3 [Drosophila subpulchrella]|uniref:neuropeptide-like protein 31 isoform X3 n=2 Tax=Drosophila subpulchrella TaxID=1486046 RepID=UPI0018A1A624|nr:neuropeptide-like protein 31 isoform X3 [Drosophila subpulchrella]